MKKFGLVLAAACGVAALGFSSLSWAEDLSVAVVSGKRTAVASYGSYNTFECTAAAVPQYRIGRMPAHGTVEVREERRVMDAGRCGNVSAHLLVVYYTAARGFRGQDAAAVDFTIFAFGEGAETRTERVNISIQVH